MWGFWGVTSRTCFLLLNKHTEEEKLLLFFYKSLYLYTMYANATANLQEYKNEVNSIMMTEQIKKLDHRVNQPWKLPMDFLLCDISLLFKLGFSFTGAQTDNLEC